VSNHGLTPARSNDQLTCRRGRVSYESRKAVVPRRSGAADHMLPCPVVGASPAAGATACSARGHDLGNQSAARPPALSTSDATPGAATRRHPASRSPRGGRHRPADYRRRHRLRRHRRRQGHPGRLPPPPGGQGQAGRLRQRRPRPRRPAGLGRPPRRRLPPALRPGGHRPLPRGPGRRPGRRRPARQRGPPRPGQGPPSPEVREFQGLARRVDDLVERSAREEGRLASPARSQAARRSVERTVRLLGREAEKVQAQADALVAATAPLRADRGLPETIPGVGRPTATAVLAELPAVQRLPGAEAAAAACGLAPRACRSGTSVRRRTRLPKAGTARLGQALDLPTLTAIRFNPLLQGFFERRVAAGKPRMAAVGACLRKLGMACDGVLKHRAPFDPHWASRKAP
jgi:transposase